MVNEVPVIPVTEGVDWYQYNTKGLSGWVTQENPYAQPAAYETPGLGRHAPSPQAEGLVSEIAERHEAREVRFVLRRLGFFVVTLWAAVTLNFLIPRLMPGNAALAMMARYKGHMNPQAMHALESRSGSTRIRA